MTIKRFVLFSAILMATLVFTSCNREAGRPGGETPSAGPSTVQRANIGALKRSLDEIDERIQAMGAVAAKEGSKVKPAVKEEIAKLEAARDAIYGRLQELQTASEDQWEDLKTRTAASVDSLGVAVSKTWRSVTAGERAASGEDGD